MARVVRLIDGGDCTGECGVTPPYSPLRSRFTLVREADTGRSLSVGNACARSRGTVGGRNIFLSESRVARSSFCPVCLQGGKNLAPVAEVIRVILDES